MKIYNNLSDKFDIKYSFDNYSDFAEFWLNLSYVTQCELFGPLMTNKLNSVVKEMNIVNDIVHGIKHQLMNILRPQNLIYNYYSL